MSTYSAVPQAEAAAPQFGVVLRAALLGAAVAGVVGALLSWLLVEVSIRAALVIESNRAPEPGHDHGGRKSVV